MLGGCRRRPARRHPTWTRWDSYVDYGTPYEDYGTLHDLRYTLSVVPMCSKAFLPRALYEKPQSTKVYSIDGLK